MAQNWIVVSPSISIRTSCTGLFVGILSLFLSACQEARREGEPLRDTASLYESPLFWWQKEYDSEYPDTDGEDTGLGLYKGMVLDTDGGSGYLVLEANTQIPRAFLYYKGENYMLYGRSFANNEDAHRTFELSGDGIFLNAMLYPPGNAGNDRATIFVPGEKSYVQIQKVYPNWDVQLYQGKIFRSVSKDNGVTFMPEGPVGDVALLFNFLKGYEDNSWFMALETAPETASQNTTKVLGTEGGLQNMGSYLLLSPKTTYLPNVSPRKYLEGNKRSRFQLEKAPDHLLVGIQEEQQGNIIVRIEYHVREMEAGQQGALVYSGMGRNFPRK